MYDTTQTDTHLAPDPFRSRRSICAVGTAPKQETFIDLVLAGEATLDDINDWVSLWHREPRGRELHEFLGMSWDEYALWVEMPAALDFLVAARRRGEPLFKVIEETSRDERADDHSDAMEIVQWLRATGRMKG
jgi:hypothetical protein